MSPHLPLCRNTPSSPPYEVFWQTLPIFLDIHSLKCYNVCMGSRKKQKTCPPYCLCRIFDGEEKDNSSEYGRKEGRPKAVQLEAGTNQEPVGEKQGSTADGESGQGPEGRRKRRRPQERQPEEQQPLQSSGSAQEGQPKRRRTGGPMKEHIIGG